MSAIYKDTNYSISHLVEDIRVGNIALPEIQRPYVWPTTKVRNLFDSLYKGFPIGTLMFWETGNDSRTRQITNTQQRAARLLIIDGQQRLTSLYAVMTGEQVLDKNFKQRKIQLAFEPMTETFHVADAAMIKSPEVIPDITRLWQPGFKSTVKAFFKKLNDVRETPLTEEQEDELEIRIDRVRDLEKARFQTIELMEKADPEDVADIFVRINSQGIKLTQSDFILTLMSVHWDEGRKALENFARSAVDLAASVPNARNDFLDPSPDQLLRVCIGIAFKRGKLSNVYTLLRGKDLETGKSSSDIRDANFAKLQAAQGKVLNLNNWHEFFKALVWAGYRGKRMITAEAAVLFAYTFWLIGKYEFNVPLPQLTKIIGRFFFMSHTTRRYSSSQESQIESDFNRFKNLDLTAEAFVGELNKIISTNFTSDYWDIVVPTRLVSSSFRSPEQFAYWAALNILDAPALLSEHKIRDLFDPKRSKPKGLEQHHLFPREFLKKSGISERRDQNQIANFAITDFPENNKIGAKAPSTYWPDLALDLSNSQLKQMEYFHALPTSWAQLDYQDFLEKRRKLMAQIIKDGFLKLNGEEKPSRLDAQDMLDYGESAEIEFKSSLRYNLHTKTRDERMEHTVAKTVCGFLNASGGDLFIGVDDTGKALGLDYDFSTLGGKGDLDGFQLFLQKLIKDKLSIPTTGLIDITFPAVTEKTICRVRVRPAPRPVFCAALKSSGPKSEFWVRNGNETLQYHGEDMITYQDDNWD